jgi:NADPH:quinone reductase-like Zn-dependent oxidoreductase
MKAVICTKYGNPEVLQIKNIDKPTPKDNQILIKVIATAVNSGDVKVRSFDVEGFMKIIMILALGFSKPRKPILGTVYSGIVESIGTKISNFKVGDKVFGMTGFNFGTYAEYIVADEKSNIELMPQNASFEEAVSLIFGGQTAIYFLEKVKIKEKPKAKILIIGGTGSVGSAAIQIANFYGAEITTVCSSNGHQLMKDLNVSNIILYDKEDFSKTSEKFDIIFDAIGKTTKKQCRKLLEKNGIYKTVGGLEYASEYKEQLVFIKELYEKGAYRAIIDKIFTLDNIVEAHKYVDTGRKKGNVVLKISDI